MVDDEKDDFENGVFDWFVGFCFVCDYVVGVWFYYWYDGLDVVFVV